MTAVTLVAAMLLDALVGEPSWLWSRIMHPAVAMGRLVTALDTALNTGAARRAKGVFAICAAVLVALAVGYAIAFFGPVAEALAAAILLAQRSLVDHVSAVARALRQSLPEGRRAVSMIVSRDTRDMTGSQTARAAIESAAENLSDGIVAPAFWFLIGGIPAMLAYKMVNTADSMVGYRNAKYEAFGWAAARLDDVLNFIPARLTALAIAMVSRVSDLAAIRADARLHRSPNAGWPEAAMARALGIALSGPRAYEGAMQDFPWVNPNGRRDLAAEDIDAAVTILWNTWGAILALSAILGVLAH